MTADLSAAQDVADPLPPWEPRLVDQVAAECSALMDAGRFQEVLAPLRLAAARFDATPSITLNLAIAEDRTGNRQRARALMQSVAVRLPEWDEPILRIAESLRAGNDLAGAEEAYRYVLTLNPNRSSALIALAGLLLFKNEPTEARELLLHCCDVAPDNAEAWAVLGHTLRAMSAPGLAVMAYIKAQVLQPDKLAYLLHGANAAIEAGEGDAELRRLVNRCKDDPLNVVLLAGQGILLDRLGRRADAIDVLEAATVLAPQSAEILGLLAGRLAHSAQVREAEDALRRVCAMLPDGADYHNEHAAVLMRLHQHEEARSILLELQARHGADLYTICNLANATACVGLQDDAVTIARSAIEQYPMAVLPHRTLCNVLPYQSGVTGLALLAALQDCSASLPRTEQPAFLNSPNADRKLVVAILSGTLRSHPVGWLTIAGFETLDPEQFSVICLAQHSSTTDPTARRFRAVAQNWVEVDGMSDAELVATARILQVDILIDMGGYGDAARMIACASRVAPVQIKWVGMQSHSSGLAEMDWFLTDRWETPPGFEPFYCERLLRMPDGYVCYSPPTHAPEVVPPPALRNGYVTFGCFNNTAKITPRVIAAWSAILNRVPASRLVLKTHQLTDRGTADRFLAAFASHGIYAARIELRGTSGHRAFMGQYGDIDIVLDPFPYTGGLTTCEALWMGVPTITLSGEIFAARHSTSHLSNAGLADWVTETVEEYIEMAVLRAADLPALARLRAELREQTRLSPLCDAPRFGRNLGVALRHTWHEWCATQPPGAAT